MEELRVVHVGLGPIGLEIAKLVARRQGLASVAAFDLDESLIGRDLADLTGTESPESVTVEPPGSVDSGSADIALHSTGSSLEQVAPQLLAFVEAGIGVISTCEELSFPWRRQPDVAARLDEAAIEAGVAVLGTGVNPGYAMDYLPLVLSGAAASVKRVRVHRVQDAGSRRLPLQRKVGAGLDIAEFERRAAAGSVRHVGLPESAEAVASALGIELADVTESLEPIIADRVLTSGLGEIAAGRVAGIRQIVRGVTADGTESVTLELEMAVGLPGPRDEVWITGCPDLHLLIPGGLSGDSATAAVVVNSIGSVLDARPGLRTMAELAPPHPRG